MPMDCMPWACQLYYNHCEGIQLEGIGLEGLLGLPLGHQEQP